MKKIGLLGSLICLWCSAANARPVSYPGGWTSMGSAGTWFSSWHMHYSPTARNSIGYRLIMDSENRYTLHAMQQNVLLKRWNAPASQANLYLKTGIGAAYDSGKQIDSTGMPTGFGGFAMDWEDRRTFFSYENVSTQLGSFNAISYQAVRIGLAPYVGDYGDLHTWLMLQTDQYTANGPMLRNTAILRLFKGVNLWEFGLSDNGDVTFNWIFRY